MAYGADVELTVRAKEEGVVTTTKSINGLTTSIRQQTTVMDKVGQSAQRTVNRYMKLARAGSLTTAQIRRLDAALKRVKNSSNITTTRMTKFGQQTANAGKQAGAMGGAVSGLAMRFVGLQAVLGYAQRGFQMLKEWVTKSIKSYRDFEKALSEVTTLLSSEHMDMVTTLQAGLENLSVTYGKSITDLTKGLYDIISAAIDTEDAIRLLNTATKASIAGVTDVATSVDVFTSILNAYGKTVAQAAEINDTLFQTVKRGKLIFKELASAMGYIVPIAAGLGVEFKEVAAAFQSATRQGQHIDMVTRGLSLMMQNIANITPSAAKAAQKYGVDLSYTALKVFGLKSILEDLNIAMTEHGAKILPEMIANMRSYRVAIALASDVGLAGFSDDLAFLETSAGRATEALAKMTKTAQMQADILTQSMEQVNRSVGKAWHNVDIWFKKAQVWWGTFLGEGFDFTKAGDRVSSIEKELYNFNKSYLTTLQISKEMENREPLFDVLIGDAEIDAKMLKDALPLDEAKQYLEYEEQLVDIREKMIPIMDDQLQLQNAIMGVKIGEDLEKNRATIDKIVSKMGGFKTEDFIPSGLDMLSKGFAGVFSLVAGYGDLLSMPLDKANTRLLEMVDNQQINQQAAQNMLNSLQDAWDYVEGSFDSAEEQMKNYSDDILTLEQAIKDLKIEVEDFYTVLSGKTFAGKLGWQKEVLAMKAMSDRFGIYTSMTIKYGDSLEKLKTSFSSYNEYVKEYNEENETALQTLSWFNEEQWNAVKANTGYSKSLEQLIEDLHKYSSSESSVAKEVKAHNLALEELNLSMKKNSLEMLKIQLSGMQKRHGLSRKEEKDLQKLKISGMENNISRGELEINAAESQLTNRVETEKNKYNELRDIYDQYGDRMKKYMFELGDGRNTDLINMQKTIDSKIERLEKYRDKLIETQDDMLSLWNAYTNALDVMSKDEGLQAMYDKLAGTERLETMNKWWEQFGKWSDTLMKQTGAGGARTAEQIKIDEELPTQPLHVESFIDKVNERQASLYDIFKGFKAPWMQRGTYNIPTSGLYNLHGGEQVIPRTTEKGMGGGNVNIHVDPITINAKLEHTDDVESIGAKIGAALSAEFISGVTSEYEVG